MNMIPGQTIMIYTLPSEMTEESKEGLAKLIQHIETNGDYELWEVEFLDNPGRYLRLIKKT
jgi:hypothetical protein